MNHHHGTTARTSLPVAAALAALTVSLTVSLTACSSGTSPSGPPPAPGTTATSAAATAPNAAAAPASATSSTGGDEGDANASPPTFTVVDVCALVPFATVRLVTGKSISKGVTIKVGQEDTGTYGCAYNTDNDDDALEVKVFASGAEGLWTLVTTDTKRTITPVSGLGDKAVYDNDSTLYARKGDYVVQVNGLTDTGQAASSRPRFSVRSDVTPVRRRRAAVAPARWRRWWRGPDCRRLARKEGAPGRGCSAAVGRPAAG